MRWFVIYILAMIVVFSLLAKFTHSSHYKVKLKDGTMTVIDTNNDHKAGELIKGDVDIFGNYVESADGNITGTVLERVQTDK